MPRRIAATVAITLGAFAGPAVLSAPAAAQRSVSRTALSPDSLVQRGLIDRAESAYYAAVRARPRDPAARWNLGRFLISRGATRVGMTLVEEAVQFGFNKARADSVLAPVYLELGEYAKLAALSPSPLSGAEKLRLRYLESHPSRTISADSQIVAAYLPATTPSLIGTIAIRVDGRPITARIVNSGPELVLPGSGEFAKRLHVFGAVGVADSIGISRLSMTSVPLTLAPSATSDARVSLQFLARFAPTFDPRAGRVALRASGQVARASTGATEFLTMVTDGQLRILKAGGWTSPTDPDIARILNARRWTLDRRRGTLVVEP